MPRPQIDAEAIRQEIMDTAEQLVRRRGATDFSVSEIASACNMSQSNFYRYFPSKEAFVEAMAGNWFAELNDIMEDVIASDASPKEKMFAFFARRLALKRARFEEDPELFQSYMEIGHQHFEVIRGYIDLGDHYLAILVADAMADGYFVGYEIDHCVSLINLMVQPFCNPDIMISMMETATDENLRAIIDAIFTGLGENSSETKPEMKGPSLLIAS